MTSLTGNLGPTGMQKEKVPTGYRKGTINQFTPEQFQLLNQMIGQIGPNSYTSRLAGGDQSTFGEMEAPALQQFSGLMGGLASRYSGAGMGARRSSGFQNESSSAAS